MDTKDSSPKRGSTTWRVRVTTGDRDHAGTDACVYMYLATARGIVTQTVELDNKEDNFERGKTDTFEVTLMDVGRPAELTIWHDNSGKYPGWFLQRIEMDNLNSSENYRFECNNWLSISDGDRKIFRTLYASN